MNKIKKVAVIIQNVIQYESFKPAIEVMKDRKIEVDILIPKIDKSEGIWEDMYDITAKRLSNENLNIKREVDEKEKYDIVFTTHEIEQFKNINKKYYIKYRYGIASKPCLSLSLNKNYLYDAILTYGNFDSETLSNYGKIFEIGNIKYANFKNDIKKTFNNKINLLYLPTYGEDSSYFEIIPELVKLKNKYNIMIKLHHGTNHLNNERENEIRKIVEENFDKVFKSEESLLDIFKSTDLVLSDNSGAIGDAIAAKIPVIIHLKNIKTYGEFIPIQKRILDQNLACELKNINELDNTIKKALSEPYMKKIDELFKTLYVCENKETKDKFNNMLNEIEKGILSEEYLQIRKNIRNEYENKIKVISEYEIKNEVLNERLKNAYNIISKLEKEAEILKKDSKTMNKIKKFFKKSKKYICK